MKLATAEYEALSRPRYGTANPERIENALWEHIVRNGWGGYGVRKQFGDARHPYPRSQSTSTYREQENGPVWSWDRMGRTSTALPDGRVVHVGGEHEDFYDPDFCIFNEVVVQHADGRLEIYGYPKDVFPPTDFHSATLVGDAIILIGSVGYQDLRRHGDCQVFRLDIATWAMQRVATSGEGPGWLAHHEAEYDGGDTILVLGGSVERRSGNGGGDATEIVRNAGLFELNVPTATWRRVAPGDMRYFAVGMDAYRAGRNPRFGNDNPERTDNPFWREMLRRKWSPKRARQHFGDLPPPRPSDPEAARSLRPVGEVVWTAERDCAAHLTLADGRQLTIGGECYDFGEQWADRWVYNDVIVEHPDGRVDILAYPPEAFPPLTRVWATEVGGRILVFGNVLSYGPGPRTAVAVALDPGTLAATVLDTVETRPAVQTQAGPRKSDAERLVFQILKRTSDEPPRYAGFNLARGKWGACDP